MNSNPNPWRTLNWSEADSQPCVSVNTFAEGQPQRDSAFLTERYRDPVTPPLPRARRSVSVRRAGMPRYSVFTSGIRSGDLILPHRTPRLVSPDSRILRSRIHRRDIYIEKRSSNPRRCPRMTQPGDSVDISYAILTRQMLRGLACVTFLPGILGLFTAALVERPITRLGLVGAACLVMWLSVCTARGAKTSICVSLTWWVGCIVVFATTPLVGIYDRFLSAESTGSKWTDLFAVLGGAIVLLWLLRRAVPYPRAVWRYCRQGSRTKCSGPRSCGPSQFAAV